MNLPNYENINDKKIDNDMIINLLLEISFIKILPSYMIQEICHSILTQKYKKNEYVIKQGEPISNLYIVKSGSFMSSINHQSVLNIGHNINVFIQYQNITNEPFSEERKYELKGKMTNNQQIDLFIYQKKNIFGDIELISGMPNSCFSIRANEDESILCYIDRNIWVQLTKRIRIPFTKITIDKIIRIQKRIEGILTRKNKMKINKIKLYNEKIHSQIEVNDNYDFCIKKIDKNETKIKSKSYNLKLNHSKSLKQFQLKKNSVLDLFKYPNIIKNETREYIDNFLHNNTKRDINKFKLNNTKSYFNLNQGLNNNEMIKSSNNRSLIYNHNKNMKNLDYLKFKSKLFLTNSIKPLKKIKNKSLNDIFNSTEKSKITFNNSINNQNSGSRSRNKIINEDEFKKYKNFSNIIIKNILKRNHSTIDNQKSNNNKYNKQYNNVKIKDIINSNNNKNNYIQSYSNKTFNNSMNNSNREKMDLEKINMLLLEKYNLSKNKIIDKLFGKKNNNSFI